MRHKTILIVCIAVTLCLFALPSQAYDISESGDRLREQVKFPMLYFSFTIDQPSGKWMEHASNSPVRLNCLVRVAIIEAVKKHPSDVDHLWEALTPEEQCKFADYERRLTAVLDSAGPDEWQVREALGLILYIRGDKKKALEHFRTAFDENPSADAAYSALLVDIRENGKLAEAAFLMERRVKSLKSASERLRLSRVYAELGRLDLAEKQCRAALDLDPKNADANYMMGVLYLKRYSSLQKAAYYLKKALADDSSIGMADCRFALAVGYLLLGEQARAVEELKQAGTPEAEKLLEELLGSHGLNVPRSRPQSAPAAGSAIA